MNLEFQTRMQISPKVLTCYLFSRLWKKCGNNFVLRSTLYTTFRTLKFAVKCQKSNSGGPVPKPDISSQTPAHVASKFGVLKPVATKGLHWAFQRQDLDLALRPKFVLVVDLRFGHRLLTKRPVTANLWIVLIRWISVDLWIYKTYNKLNLIILFLIFLMDYKIILFISYSKRVYRKLSTLLYLYNLKK